MVSGTIDAKFDVGYVVTVTLGSEQLKGVLFHVPDNVSQSSHAEGTSSSQNLGDDTSNLQSRKRAKYAPRDPFRPKSNRSKTKPKHKTVVIGKTSASIPVFLLLTDCSTETQSSY